MISSPSDGRHGLTSVVAGSPRAARAAFSFVKVPMNAIIALVASERIPGFRTDSYGARA